MAKRYGPLDPAEILIEAFLSALGVGAGEFAPAIRAPPNRMTRQINGQSPATPDTALRLARARRPTSEFWAKFQWGFDLGTVADASGSFVDVSPIVAA